ncbi:MAG: TIGR01777 family oxidoreductase [Cyanobacteria bacterium SZAS LIN-3]|nr:TIGR01777 family oxidoreductase [Cyanobacteria bacterium SZAS LIN-3]
MKNQIFEARVHLHHSPERVFRWHERDGAFERLSPPWLDVDCVERSGGIRNGSRVVLLVKKGPLAIPWVLGHKDYVQDQHFVDYQIAGPFQSWQQIHQVAASQAGPEESDLIDRAEFRLPMGLAGSIFGSALIKSDLTRLFRYRHALMRRDLGLQKRYGQRPLRILVSGGSGLVGSQLIPFLTTQGHSVVQLVRSAPDAANNVPSVEKIVWDPESKSISVDLPGNLDGAVHLGGYNVAQSNWTPGVKRTIEDSRVNSTEYLVSLFARMESPPPVFVCASAMDFYGDRGSEPVTEDSGGGEGFLATVCKRWEEAASRAADPALGLNMRVVNLRISGVLHPKGGVLGKLLPVFRAGAGGPVGTGAQYFSWISMDDMLGCIYHALVEESVRGPLNAVAPHCLTNKEFGATLGRVLHRPALVPLPETAVRVMFGEMGEALLLASRRLLPQKLKQTGYQFLDPELGEALKYMLGLSAGYEG